MKVKPKSLKNLKPPFPKGTSGNPKGRPKGSLSLTNNLRKMLQENPDDVTAINKALVKAAKKGMLGHTQHVYDRIDGPNKVKVDVSVFSEAFNDKAKEELEDILQKNQR